MGSPNQYSSEEDKAKGYPFALSIIPGEGEVVDGKEYHAALYTHGVEELLEVLVMSMLMPPESFLVLWGWGRATGPTRSLRGFPDMPVLSVKQFIAKQKQGVQSCVQ